MKRKKKHKHKKRKNNIGRKKERIKYGGEATKRER